MSDLTNLARVTVSILDDPKALDLFERLGPGEVGCRACGGVSPKTDGLVCAHCGVDLRKHGYLDGDALAVTERVARKAS